MVLIQGPPRAHGLCDAGREGKVCSGCNRHQGGKQAVEDRYERLSAAWAITQTSYRYPCFAASKVEDTNHSS